MQTFEQQLDAQIARNEAVLTPLGAAIKTHLEFEIGWTLCKRYQPIDTCSNEQQRRGWWAYLDAEAEGMK